MRLRHLLPGLLVTLAVDKCLARLLLQARRIGSSDVVAQTEVEKSRWEHCQEQFKTCWKVSSQSWRRTPECSGVPSACEEELCTPDVSACTENGHECELYGDMCSKRRYLESQGCQSPLQLKQIGSADAIYLKTVSGNYVDSSNSTLQARWPERGLWQSLFIEKDASGPVLSGDTVFIRSHEDKYLHVENGTVSALAGGHDHKTAVIIEKDGGGAISSGDTIFLRHDESKRLLAGGADPLVRISIAEPGRARVPEEALQIEKELELEDATAVNFGDDCEEHAHFRHLHSGDVVFLRTYFQNIVHVANDTGAVEARFDDHGEWQALRIEKKGGSYINSGDTVFLVASNGAYLEVSDYAVRASATQPGLQQSLLISKDSGGLISFGDTIFLKAQSGNFIDIQNETVQARWQDHSNTTVITQQGLLLESGKSEEEVIQFLHIPKTGGTTIEDTAWLRKIAWGRKAIYGMAEMPGGNLFCSAHHTPLSYLPAARQKRFIDKEVFCVTRHPYDRAVSEYSYLLGQAQERARDSGQQAQTNGTNSNKDLFVHPPCSVEALNYFLQKQLEKAKQRHRKFISDCHFLPQSEYIWDNTRLDHPGERQWCTDVLRMDDLPMAFNNMMAKKGYSMRLTTEHHNSNKDLCPDLKVSSLNDETITLLNEVYAEDFRRLGYNPTKVS